ncbi:hypothetical protein [Labilibaculum sp.]|uniref:hypothetical protein n=1 Tax=Labilibaculum sp. TaxID=2060723 RepID=UPI00356718BD
MKNKIVITQAVLCVVMFLCVLGCHNRKVEYLTLHDPLFDWSIREDSTVRSVYLKSKERFDEQRYVENGVVKWHFKSAKDANVSQEIFDYFTMFLETDDDINKGGTLMKSKNIWILHTARGRFIEHMYIGDDGLLKWNITSGAEIHISENLFDYIVQTQIVMNDYIKEGTWKAKQGGIMVEPIK